MARFLDERSKQKGADGVQVKRIAVDGQLDSAEVLRQIKDEITQDFLVIKGDVICDEHLQVLAKLYRSKKASVAMLLKEEEEAEVKKGKKVRPERDEEDVDYIGLAADGRVVMKTPAMFVGEDIIKLQKSLLRRNTRITITTRLQDVGIYAMAHAVLDYLEEHREICSIENGLIPALVSMQFLTADANASAVDSTAHEVQSHTPTHAEDSLDENSEQGIGEAPRCFAAVLKNDGAFCERANTLSSYAKINSRIMAKGLLDKLKVDASEFNKKQQTVIARSSLGTRSTASRQC
ncbi:unnamed protein product [Chrysoparadoxa australica]